MLEWYHSPGDYNTIMDELYELIKFIASNLKISEFKVRGKPIPIFVPWKKISFLNCISEFLNIPISDLSDSKILSELTGRNENEGWENLIEFLFISKVEKSIGLDCPYFIFDFPVHTSSMSKIHPEDKRFCQRVELYIGGIEIANAFTELFDKEEILKRFKTSARIRRSLKKKPHQIDYEFLDFIDLVLSDFGGVALGLDRLIMLFMNKSSIQDVIAFPISYYFND